MGDELPDPDEEAKVADIGVLVADGDLVRLMRSEPRPGTVGIGGGGLDTLRRVARRSPMLAALSRNASCIRKVPVDGSRMRDSFVALGSKEGGGCWLEAGVGKPPSPTAATSPGSTTTGFTPQSFARCRNLLTLAKTPRAAFARAFISFTSSTCVSSPGPSTPLALRAHPTSFDNSTRTTFLSFARMGNDTRVVLSLLRQSVCIKAARMEEMTQAVDGCMWGLRFK